MVKEMQDPMGPKNSECSVQPWLLFTQCAFNRKSAMYIFCLFIFLCALGSVVGVANRLGQGMPQKFGRFGSVQVDYPSTYSAPTDTSVGNRGVFGSPWPDAIQLNTNYSTSSKLLKRRSARRTYRWKSTELLIECNMTALDNPTCTRLVPPLSWMSASGSKVKVSQVSAPGQSNGFTLSKDTTTSLTAAGAGAGVVERSMHATVLVKEEDVERLFRSIDIDNNGYIDSYELYRALSRLGMQVTPRDIERMIADADTSEPKDSRIDLEEWRLLVANINAWSTSQTPSPSSSSSSSSSSTAGASAGGQAAAIAAAIAGTASASASSVAAVDGKRDVGAAAASHYHYHEDEDEDEGYPPMMEGSEKHKYVTISVNRNRAEKSLSSLRQFGFRRADIYRMLEKGPWVLAFDIMATLPRISDDLTLMLGLTKKEALHVVSHCPYLIAQYARYKGRDVYTTARALIEVGYSTKNLVDDVIRFPSMLSAPPDRLRGWMALLEGYGVKTGGGLFGKTLRRAPFMFYVNPPYFLFQDDDASVRERNTHDVSTTASEFVVFEALRVLKLLSAYGLDMDKVIRSQPSLLLVSADEVHRRAHFLLNLFLERKHQLPLVPLDEDVSMSMAMTMDTDVKGERGGCNNPQQLALAQLNTLIQSNPKVLSTEAVQMKNSANALLRSGMRRKDVIQLAKRYPAILSVSPSRLRRLVGFFKVQCGLRKSDLINCILRAPQVLTMEIDTLDAKVEYLYGNMGGHVAMLRKWPLYLTYDLATEIRPRAEFVRACGFNPLFRDLPQLLTLSAEDLSYSMGLQPEVFGGFKDKYLAMWTAAEAEKRKEEDEKKAANEKWQTVLAQKQVEKSPSSSSSSSSSSAWAEEDSTDTLDVDDLLEESEVYFD